jgi:hypothetical protein
MYMYIKTSCRKPQTHSVFVNETTLFLRKSNAFAFVPVSNKIEGIRAQVRQTKKMVEQTLGTDWEDIFRNTYTRKILSLPKSP